MNTIQVYSVTVMAHVIHVALIEGGGEQSSPGTLEPITEDSSEIKFDLHIFYVFQDYIFMPNVQLLWCWWCLYDTEVKQWFHLWQIVIIHITVTLLYKSNKTTLVRDHLSHKTATKPPPPPSIFSLIFCMIICQLKQHYLSDMNW